MSKQTDRENYIMRMLIASGRVTVADVVSALNISEATARRTFVEMERDGKVIRNYGGIVPVKSLPKYRFDHNISTHSQEKAAIGELAANLVEEDDTLFLDCGTTVFYMAMALAERLNRHELLSVNIVTNSIPNLQVFTPNLTSNVVLLGGTYNGIRQDFSGSLTESYLEPFHFTKCFLGTDGLSTEGGFFSTQVSQSRLNQKVIQRSVQSYILMENRKFARQSFISFTTPSEIYGIITETPPDQHQMSLLRGSSLRLYTPQEPRGITVV
jgi:DeoR family fructose operon transcriptional repressor